MTLVRNTLNLECLLEALDEYAEAKRDHDVARDKYISAGGFSWGYYGRVLIEHKERKAAEFGERLNTLIDVRLKLGLEKEGKK